jgi:hypothetical protein
MTFEKCSGLAKKTITDLEMNKSKGGNLAKLICRSHG